MSEFQYHSSPGQHPLDAIETLECELEIGNLGNLELKLVSKNDSSAGWANWTTYNISVSAPFEEQSGNLQVISFVSEEDNLPFNRWSEVPLIGTHVITNYFEGKSQIEELVSEQVESMFSKYGAGYTLCDSAFAISQAKLAHQNKAYPLLRWELARKATRLEFAKGTRANLEQVKNCEEMLNRARGDFFNPKKGSFFREAGQIYAKALKETGRDFYKLSSYLTSLVKK